MNQESLETWETLKAREYREKQKRLNNNLLMGLAILIAGLYVLFFVGNQIKWPLLGVLAFMYILTRVL